MIKYGLIADADFYQWIADHAQALLTLDTDILTEAIARSCQAKADIVSQDEKEAGIRAIPI